MPLVRRCRNDHSMAYQVPLLTLIFINVAFSSRPLGTGMHFQTLLSPLLKVSRMVLLSALLWWELGTSLPGHGSGEWLSFWRVTSNNSDSESHPLCSLKNPTVVYMITCRLSPCKTGVYNVRLLIILERGCSSMYRKKERKKKATLNEGVRIHGAIEIKHFCSIKRSGRIIVRLYFENNCSFYTIKFALQN